MAIEIFIISSIHTPEQVAYTEKGILYDISIYSGNKDNMFKLCEKEYDFT